MNYNMNSAPRRSSGTWNSKAGLVMNIYGDMVPARKEPAVRPKRHWAAPVTTFSTGKQGDGYNDSDHLYMADVSKYNGVSQKLFGDQSQLWWDSRTPAQVEMFLREYFDNPALVLVKIQKMYNVSNGGPIWGFSYQR